MLHWAAGADGRGALMAGDTTAMHEDNLDDFQFNRAHGVTLLCCGLIFAGILLGVQYLDWWLADMAGGFFLMGLIAAGVCRLSIEDSAKAFTKGLGLPFIV